MSELTAKKFVKRLAGFSVASWISAAISFFATPILTRLYTPAEMGSINVFITCMTFFQMLCVMALDQAFMRFYNEDMPGIRKDNLLTFCLKHNILFCLFSAIIILVAYKAISFYISGAVSFDIPVCLAISVFCYTLLRMNSISARMQKNMLLYTMQVVGITVIEKILFSISAIYTPTHRAAIYVMTAGFSVLTFLSLSINKKRALCKIKKVPSETTKEIFKFAIPYMPVLALSWLNGSLPLIVLNTYVDKTAIGIYTSAVTIANILSIIQTGFSAYWGPLVYEHYKQCENDRKIEKIQRSVVCVLVFGVLSIILLQDVVYHLLGEEYRASKVFFPFLMLIPVCNCLGDMMGIGIMLSKKSYLNIWTFTSSICANVCLSYFLIPRMGVIGAAIAAGCAALIMLIVRSSIGSRYYRPSRKLGYIVFGVLLIVLAAVINLLFSSHGIVRGALLHVLIGAALALYWKDIAYLVKVLISFFKKK